MNVKNQHSQQLSLFRNLTITVAGSHRIKLIIVDVNSILGAASPPEACDAESLDCPNYYDQIGLEAIRSLHRQLDDDDNGDIDLSESDDVKQTNQSLRNRSPFLFDLSVPTRRVKVRRRLREATSGVSLQRRHAHFRQRVMGGLAEVRGP